MSEGKPAKLEVQKNIYRRRKRSSRGEIIVTPGDAGETIVTPGDAEEPPTTQLLGVATRQ